MESFMTRDSEFPNNNSRIEEIQYNSAGSILKIINYRLSHDVDVMIITTQASGQVNYYLYKNSNYQDFKNGNIHSPYDRTCSGVGYMGVGIYNSINNYKLYTQWVSMMRRCYSTKFKVECPTYINVCADSCFHNFQNFSVWCEENYYSFDNENMVLDKDILIKGNKVYGPNTCCFVPQRINTLFVKRDAVRGDTPIGVYKCTEKGRKTNPYSSYISANGKRVHLGRHPTPEAAFQAYKIAKEEEIKRVANYYWNEKGGQFIPQFKRVYEAMMNYTVEMED